MFTSGLILFFLGALGFSLIPPKKEGLEMRDLVGTVPIIVGFAAMVLSLVIHLCKTLP